LGYYKERERGGDALMQQCLPDLRRCALGFRVLGYGGFWGS